jgi:hypothetical protein
MIMNKFKVNLMGTCLNAIQNTGTEVDFVSGGYTGCVQILDKGANRPFKLYVLEEFENWMFLRGTLKIYLCCSPVELDSIALFIFDKIALSFGS